MNMNVRILSDFLQILNVSYLDNCVSFIQDEFLHSSHVTTIVTLASNAIVITYGFIVDPETLHF